MFIRALEKTKASELEKGLPDRVIPQWIENTFQGGGKTRWAVNDCGEGGVGGPTPVVCVDIQIPQKNGYSLHINSVVGNSAGEMMDKPHVLQVYFYKGEGHKTIDVIHVKTISEAIEIYKTELKRREQQ
jgi:hypothetical protein